MGLHCVTSARDQEPSVPLVKPCRLQAASVLSMNIQEEFQPPLPPPGSTAFHREFLRPIPATVGVDGYQNTSLTSQKTLA